MFSTLHPIHTTQVWNYDNRERVRRDEAQAKVDEEERRVRAEAADQESRLAVLRTRAGLPVKTDAGGPAVESDHELSTVVQYDHELSTVVQYDHDTAGAVAPVDE